jgi:TPR repeat protein
MSHLFRRDTLLIFVVAMFYSGLGIAGIAEGLEALKKGDYATASRELRPLAERGNSEAQYRLGLMYEFGKGFAVDKAQAMVWLRKAAAQGNASAEVELGVIYATGDGVPQDDAQAVDWFQKAATQGDATAQFNLGLMYAKGHGVPKDDAQAIAWFRKAADQGFAGAQFKLGVAYENGEGVAKDSVLAYANYSIAARDGNQEYIAHRDGIARKFTPSQIREARALAAAWEVGKPMPVRAAALKDQAVTKAAPGAQAQDKCSATGLMEGEKFVANHCAVALFGDQHSVAIWFNEDPISPTEAESFQTSSYADGAKAGKQRTLATIMFCPGGSSTTASAAAVKSIELNTNHAKSALSGVQWVVASPNDFKVEKMTGDVKPGGMLTGRIVGSRGRTTWNFEFDVKLPAKDAAAGIRCVK